MSELADFLHKLIDSIDRPADHPAAELHEEVDQLAKEEAPAEEAPASPEAESAPEPVSDVTEPIPPDLAAQPELPTG